MANDLDVYEYHVSPALQVLLEAAVRRAFIPGLFQLSASGSGYSKPQPVVWAGYVGPSGNFAVPVIKPDAGDAPGIMSVTREVARGS